MTVSSVSVQRVVLVGPLLEGQRPPQLSRRDRLIGVDGGAALALSLGLTPDLAIGDWDSVTVRERQRIFAAGPHIVLSPDKDRSDLHYGLMAALQWNPQEILALGFTGGRPDHQLATLLDFAALPDEIPERVARGLSLRSLRLSGPDGEYFFLSEKNSRWDGRLKKGQTVSVFALGGAARGVSLKGFKFSTKNVDFFPSSQGLSNLSQEATQRIQLRSGRLVVIVPTLID